MIFADALVLVAAGGLPLEPWRIDAIWRMQEVRLSSLRATNAFQAYARNPSPEAREAFREVLRREMAHMQSLAPAAP